MPPKGCGTWKERAIPMAQRRAGESGVTSRPSNTTRPPSGATVPVMIPNSVVLPAPFGPMMPSASPSPSARSIRSAMTIAPKRLEILSRARMGGLRGRPADLNDDRHPEVRAKRASKDDRPGPSPFEGRALRGLLRVTGRTRNLRQQLQLAADQDLGRRLVGGDDEIELVALALPLARHQRRLGDVLPRLSGPFHRSDDRSVVGRNDRVENRLRLQILGALEHVDCNLEQRVLEADGLRPGPPGPRRIG